mmetsp:Transcript_29527/g.28701  ORF Transcript_29527/g.28701 Transcript_29527/m.28701 type:complete len:136 (-) Transcript_29527:876-1283(-)
MESQSNEVKPKVSQKEFYEAKNDDDFKQNVCIPYFKDIYKDLSSRSDDKSKGVNKFSMLEYANLPGMLGERFFSVIDSNGDSYLDSKEFVTGLLRVFDSTFEVRTKFVFDLYDFDSDGEISKDDILAILNYMPLA